MVKKILTGLLYSFLHGWLRVQGGLHVERRAIAAGLAAKVSELSATRGEPGALQAPDSSGVEMNGADGEGERRGAPAPLIHSRDS